MITLIADAAIYVNVARPTQKPSSSLTGASSMVAIKPPVPIADLYIMSSIVFSPSQVGGCSDQRLRLLRTRPGRSPLHPMPTYGQQFHQGR